MPCRLPIRPRLIFVMICIYRAKINAALTYGVRPVLIRRRIGAFETKKESGMRILASLIAIAIGGGAVLAGEADVVGVKMQRDRDGTYSFDVTVRHGDTGWKHFANKWAVFAPDGKTVLGTRTLHHPHEDEQPFTRSQSGIRIPEGTKFVIIRAHDSVHGYGGVEKRVELGP